MKKKTCINWLFRFLLLLIIAIIVYGLDLKVKLLHFNYLPFAILCIILALFFVVFIFSFCFTINSFKSRSVMSCDKTIMAMAFFFLIFAICYFPAYSVNTKDSLTIFIFSASVFCLSLLYFLLRLCLREKTPTEFTKTNLLTFTGLCDKELGEGEKDSYFGLAVNPVSGDKEIINREPIETILKDSIKTSYSDPKAIIGVTGPWGVGKTSSINHVIDMLTKEKERDVFVKDLSLWDCQDEKSIFRKFISSIFDQLKIGYSDWEIERYVERCLNKAFDSQKIPLSLPVSDGGDGEDEITEQANRYLANNKKRLVVVIDDFDRMEPKYVLFVYKAVASVLRFENVTYVLCYDEQRVSEAFLSLRVPFDYLNKIVSMHISIQMPSPSEMSKTYLICLSHFLASSKRFKKQKDDDEMAKLANDCARYCQTIREFELFINRIWFLAFSDSPLDFYDDLRLALLHLINPGVWYEIKNNYQYFVRDHTVDDPFMGSVLQNDSGGIDSGQYFAEFNKKYGPNLNQLLYELFPNLATSLPVNNFEINEENKGKQLLLPRANNDFFISLFFTQCDNEYKSALTDLNLLFGNPNSPLTSASLDSFYQKNGAFGIAILLDFISYQKSDYGFYETAIWSLNAPKVNLESLTLLTRRSLFSECFQAISDQAKRKH